MAQVFRAVREEDGETVALKIMKADMIEDDVYKHRFVHEARSASTVRHANLVPIYEAGEAGGHPYLAAGYVRGQTLEQRIELLEGAVRPDRRAGRRHAPLPRP